jgi:CRP-like cAMP-binding protein
MHLLTVSAGDIVYREGDLGPGTFLVKTGEVVMEHHGVNVTAGPGDLIGFSALIDRPYGTTARAASDCALLVFTRVELRALIRTNPDEAMRIIDGMISMLARVNTARDEQLDSLEYPQDVE